MNSNSEVIQSDNVNFESYIVAVKQKKLSWDMFVQLMDDISNNGNRQKLLISTLMKEFKSCIDGNCQSQEKPKNLENHRESLIQGESPLSVRNYEKAVENEISNHDKGGNDIINELENRTDIEKYSNVQSSSEPDVEMVEFENEQNPKPDYNNEIKENLTFPFLLPLPLSLRKEFGLNPETGDFENISETNPHINAKDNTKNISAESNKIMCSQCNIEFGDYDRRPHLITQGDITKAENQLKHHMSIFHEENFKCIQCGEDFSGWYDKSKARKKLSQHIGNVHSDAIGKYRKNLDSSKRSKKENVNDLSVCITNERPFAKFACSYCQKTFSQKGNCVNHIHKMHPSKVKGTKVEKIEYYRGKTDDYKIKINTESGKNHIEDPFCLEENMIQKQDQILAKSDQDEIKINTGRDKNIIDPLSIEDKSIQNEVCEIDVKNESALENIGTPLVSYFDHWLSRKVPTPQPDYSIVTQKKSNEINNGDKNEIVTVKENVSEQLVSKEVEKISDHTYVLNEFENNKLKSSTSKVDISKSVPLKVEATNQTTSDVSIYSEDKLQSVLLENKAYKLKPIIVNSTSAVENRLVQQKTIEKWAPKKWYVDGKGEQISYQLLSCKICKQEYQAKYMNRHISLEHEDKFRCLDCDEEFFTKPKLQNHFWLFHEQDMKKWTCKFCDTKFSKVVGLHEHIKRTHKDNPDKAIFKCEFCEIYFETIQRKRKHIGEKHMDQVIYKTPKDDDIIQNEKHFCKCYKCDKVFKTRSSLYEHKKEYHSVTCSKCGKIFLNLEQNHLKMFLNQHEKICECINSNPMEVDELICKLCQKDFTHYHSLESHFESVHKKIHNCDKCKSSYSRHKDLLLHVQIVHEGIKPSMCDTCGKTYTKEYQLEVHKKSEHLLQFDHKCEICGKGYVRNSDLTEHIRKDHEKRLDFKCELCFKAFFRQAELKSHIWKMHKNPKWTCEICSEIIDQGNPNTRMKDHIMKVHNSVRMHLCDKCSRSFHVKTELQIHYNLCHKGENTIKCRICDLTCKNRIELHKHKISAHPNEEKPERPHKCKLCEARFRQKVYLAEHVKRVHEGIKRHKWK